MNHIYSVPLSELVEEFDLIPLYKASDFNKIRITVDDVGRPGLQLAGFFDHFEPMRLQVLGNVETSYLRKLSSEQRAIIFDHLFSYQIPALIIARGLEPLPECLEMAKKHNITVLRGHETTSYIVSSLISSLKSYLAPRITRHGVLVEIYGEGILIIGDSGIGKSETAIELVKRGHRLVADDAVEIRRGTGKRLIGRAPDLIRYYMELRGIGVVDIRRLFGMSAVKYDSTIDMLINLEVWREDAVYDRLGADECFTNVLDVQLPTLTIPVKPGRNMAVIIEVAAMNNRNRKMGHNSALEFSNQVDAHIAEKSQNGLF